MFNVNSPDGFSTYHVFDDDRHVADIYYEPDQRKPWKGYIGKHEVFSCRSYNEVLARLAKYFHVEEQ